MIVKKLMRRRITNEIWEQVKTAFASGIGLREIARNMEISAGTILSRASREGWTREIQNAKALARREDAPVVSPLKAVVMTMQRRGERHVERMAGVSERGVDHIERIDGPEILGSVDRIDKLDKVARRTFGLNDDDAHNPNAIINIAMLSVDPDTVRIKHDASRELGVSE
jgi:hypothetical protein